MGHSFVLIFPEINTIAHKTIEAWLEGKINSERLATEVYKKSYTTSGDL